MSSHDSPTSEPNESEAPCEDSEVGYCKPPKNRRFRKGISGNPKGRSAGQKKNFYDYLE